MAQSYSVMRKVSRVILQALGIQSKQISLWLFFFLKLEKLLRNLWLEILSEAQFLQ